MAKKKKGTMTRSENMSRVHSKDTKPEIYIRKLLYNRGYRYRVNYKEIPGSPDLYLTKQKVAIFVNGCFWHKHKGCKLATIPKINTVFWEKKLNGNVERDMRNYEELQRMRIKVLVIWGCMIKDMIKDDNLEKKIMKKIDCFILDDVKHMEI